MSSPDAEAPTSGGLFVAGAIETVRAGAGNCRRGKACQTP
jgi:hypothetical protein